MPTHLQLFAERLRDALRPRALLRALAAVAFSALLAAFGAGTFDELPLVRSAEAAPPLLRGLAPLAEEHHLALAARARSLAPARIDEPSAALSVAHPHAEPKKVALNSATVAELCTLPGIGPKRAEQIVALREKLGGRFKRLEDLRRVRGIGRKKLEQLRPLVVLDVPPEPSPAPSSPAPS